MLARVTEGHAPAAVSADDSALSWSLRKRRRQALAGGEYGDPLPAFNRDWGPGMFLGKVSGCSVQGRLQPGLSQVTPVAGLHGPQCRYAAWHCAMDAFSIFYWLFGLLCFSEIWPVARDR